MNQNTLSIPAAIREMLPHAFGYGASRESFVTQTGLTLILLEQHTPKWCCFRDVTHLQRATRLAQQGCLMPINWIWMKPSQLCSLLHLKPNRAMPRPRHCNKWFKEISCNTSCAWGAIPRFTCCARGSSRAIVCARPMAEKSKRSAFKHYYRSTIENYFEHPSEIQLLQTPKILMVLPLGPAMFFNSWK